MTDIYSKDCDKCLKPFWNTKNSDLCDECSKAISNKSGVDLIKCKNCFEYIYPINSKVTLCFWCNYANETEEE